MGEKRLYGCSCLSWCDKVSSAPPRRARTPAPPQDRSPTCWHAANPIARWVHVPSGTSATEISQGLAYLPAQVARHPTEDGVCSLAPEQHRARTAGVRLRGQYPQGRRADPFPRPFTPQTCQLLSQKSGNKEELIPGFKCIF